MMRTITVLCGLSVLLTAAGTSACSAPPLATDAVRWDRSRAMIVTQVSREVGERPVMAIEPDERYPTGSRIVLVATPGPLAAPQVLSTGLAAAGAPSLSPAADRLLMAGHEVEGSAWRIYEVDLLTGRRAPLSDNARDCTQPAYLPGDLIVCACADVAATARPRRWSLFTRSHRRAEMHRITFGPGSAFDPTPLTDGRILFSMQQKAGAGRLEDGAVALFTINPDGTMLAPFTGSHAAPALRRRARLTDDGGVIYLQAEASGAAAAVARVEMSLPQSSQQVLAPEIDPLAIEWLAPGELLVAGWPASAHGGRTSGVFIWTAASTARPLNLFDEPAWHEIEALAVHPHRARMASRPRPSAVRSDTDTGVLVCTDVGRSDGRHGPRSGSPTPTAVVVDTLVAGSRGVERTERLGQIDLAADASFHVEIPADIPLRVTGLDAEGQALGRSDWFWVRPGEVRTCYGCHESRASAPVNRSIVALAGGPVRLARSPATESP